MTSVLQALSQVLASIGPPLCWMDAIDGQPAADRIDGQGFLQGRRAVRQHSSRRCVNELPHPGSCDARF